MTAVAEGASLLAASTNWDSEDRELKRSIGQIAQAELDAAFTYIAHTPTDTSRIAVKLNGDLASALSDFKKLNYV